MQDGILVIISIALHWLLFVSTPLFVTLSRSSLSFLSTMNIVGAVRIPKLEENVKNAVNLYSEIPNYELSLDEFEVFALKRLKVSPFLLTHYPEYPFLLTVQVDYAFSQSLNL
jgi:hypothetical protein